jgi:hypothetical protein
MPAAGGADRFYCRHPAAQEGARDGQGGGRDGGRAGAFNFSVVDGRKISTVRKKAEKAQDEAGRERALATAEELRRKREAEAAAAAAANPKDPKVNEHGDKIMGKLRVRDSKTVKILPTKDTGSNEIMVDPFPEDEGKPVTGNQPPPDARENTQPKRPGRK